eukprot:CFRG1599T1
MNNIFFTNRDKKSNVISVKQSTDTIVGLFASHGEHKKIYHEEYTNAIYYVLNAYAGVFGRTCNIPFCAIRLVLEYQTIVRYFTLGLFVHMALIPTRVNSCTVILILLRLRRSLFGSLGVSFEPLSVAAVSLIVGQSIISKGGEE